ncbi:MAG: gamma-glutamylcyclotransferase family protein [Cellulosilyticaceae bacterium]
MEKIFVYGSLRTQFWNHDKVLKNRVRKVEEATIKGELFHLPEGYPAVVEGKETIYGELLTVSQEKILKSIDFLEGYFGEGEDNLYVRKKIKVATEAGEEEGWTYMYVNASYAKKKGRKVAKGDWAHFVENDLKRIKK